MSVGPAKYAPIPLQLEICNLVMPSTDDLDSTSHETYYGPPFAQSVGFRVKNELNLTVLGFIMRKLAREYRVLSTRFYRNDKILDADLECLLDGNVPTIESMDYDAPASESLLLDTILMNSYNWRSKIGIDKPFGILMLRPSEGNGDRFVVLSACTAVADQLSLAWLSKELFRLYSMIPTGPEHIVTQERMASILASQVSFETEPFEDTTEDYRHRKQDMAFWRDQFIETTKETLGRKERSGLQNELSKLATEKAALQVSLESVSKRGNALEAELVQLRQQRRELDDGSITSSQPFVYIDSDTGEVIHISQLAKKVLTRTVLGDEAADDNVIPLLEKHEISKEVQRKIDAQSLTLEAFSNMTGANLDIYGLLTRDRKRILALADYVRNRLKESVHEQSKVKFTIERKIASTTRALEATTEAIRESKKSLESVDDMSIRLKNVLNPPLIEKITEPINMKPEYDILNHGIGKAATQYGFTRFQIPQDVVLNLHSFRSNWVANIRNKRARNTDDSSDVDSLLGSASESEDLDDKHTWNSKKTVNAVCLSAFVVLLRHISGMEKFLVGISTSFRYNGLSIGPLSDTLPIKVDVSQKGLTFDTLFAMLYKTFHHTKIHGKACPSQQIARELQVDNELPARFEYVTNTERKEWAKLGLFIYDLFYEQAGENVPFGPAFQAERVWTLNEQDDYDIKLIMIENNGTIECAFRYRKDRFSDDKIEKWISKFQSTLELIDPVRKLKVAGLISK